LEETVLSGLAVFPLLAHFRDVEELLAQRRIVVTYETVRQWCLKFDLLRMLIY
jgi:transposase-like protein